MAKALTAAGIEVISADSLLVLASSAVQGLFAFMKMLAAPQDASARLNAWLYLHQRTQAAETAPLIPAPERASVY